MYIELHDEEDVRDATLLVQAKSEEKSDISHIRVQLDLPLAADVAPDSLRVFFDCIRSHFGGGDTTTGVELYMTSSSAAASPNENENHIVNTTPTTSVEELARIFEQVPNLSLLEIDELHISGSDITRLAKSLKCQSQLRTVYLHDINMDHMMQHQQQQHQQQPLDNDDKIQNNHSEGSLQPLADALSSLPQLETLELYKICFSKNSTLNAQCLAHIARCCKAKRLEIMPCSCHDVQEQGLAVTHGLLNNSILEKLSLMTCTFPQNSLQQQQQQQRQQQQRQQQKQQHSGMFQDGVIKSIGQVLEHNPTRLQALELNVCGDINLLPLTKALETNRTLQSLYLCWDTYYVTPGKNVNALRRVLRDHNFVLERLEITIKDLNGVFGQEWVDPILEFYLHLNVLGRQSLLGGTSSIRGNNDTTNTTTASREDWIEMLSKCQDDVSSLFYFLSVNPLMCYESLLVEPVVSKRARRVLSPKRKRHCAEWR